MGRYLLGRVLHSILALWVAVTATFLAIHRLPGDPFGGAQLDPDTRRRLIQMYGLGLPLWRQYTAYLSSLMHGRLGWSLVSVDQSVGAVVAQALPVSLTIGALALLWAVPVGVGLGLMAAHRRGGVVDRLTLGIGVLGLGVPSFVVAVLLDYLVGVRLRWLPVAGWGTPADGVLPALALGLTPCAAIARLVRTQALEALGSEYVGAARARGLSPAFILVRHVLRNALLPTVTAIGPLAANVLIGSFVIESIFAVPGLGRVFVQSVLDRDYPLVTGITVVYAALVLACNLVADILAAAVDPRIRLAGGSGA